MINLISTFASESNLIWNIYGPAEATIDCTFHLVEINAKTENVPIGFPLPNYQCLIKDDFLQDVIINQEGELFVGGVGVFAGYLGQDDLTAKVLVEIDGEMFYRTGDLVRLDNDGLLHYIGRKDYQIKIHGQRIELGEIEQCLLNISFISGCVVMKWNDDHLVAYVQSSSVDENQLREHCQSHLPSHMIPSFFVILEKLPLNANGKIDRKQLPSPRFSPFSSTCLTDHTIAVQSPTNDIELIIHDIWCDVLQHNQIAINTNIFTIGGHSLLIIRLLHRYKIEFGIGIDSLHITDLFQYPTIVGHVQLIQHSLINPQNIHNSHWYSLHLTYGEYNSLSLSLSLSNIFLNYIIFILL